MLRHARGQVFSVAVSRRLVALNESALFRVRLSSLAFPQKYAYSTWSNFSACDTTANPFLGHPNRTLITPTGEWSEEEEFERTTATTLNARATPLGTMPETQFENSLAATRYWLSPQQYQPSAYDVLRADQLLQRLIAEHASGTMSARRYTETLAETQTKVSYFYGL